MQDGAETVPTRLQDMTDGECYHDYKDEYEAEVGRVMELHGEKLQDKVRQWPYSEDKQRRLAFAEEVKTKFPSLSWYILQKPAEVRPMHDHTTGDSHIKLVTIPTRAHSMSVICPVRRVQPRTLRPPPIGCSFSFS